MSSSQVGKVKTNFSSVRPGLGNGETVSVEIIRTLNELNQF
ncbi:hypothetical protein [Chryseobacterium sp. Leaf405]|nr:hypothetical protein [Chryseobacterium sp. Leaf405]